MALKLSNTAIDMYRMCGVKYKHHYLDKLREDGVGSALIFGSALDDALNVLLLRKKEVLTDKEKELAKKDPHRVLEKKMEYFPLNNKMIQVSMNPKVYYFKADFDHKVYTKDDLDIIFKLKLPNIESFNSLEDIKDFYDYYTSNKEDKDINETKLFNFINWISLKRKGHYLLDLYEKEILPNITKVFEIQKTIKLENEEGDIIRGFLDFDAEWKGERVIFDNKTASRKYKEDSVINSQQLMIYGEDSEHHKAGYIVLLKNFKYAQVCSECGTEANRKRKKCGECGSTEWEEFEAIKPEYQVIIDDLDNDKQNEVFEEIRQVAVDIKEEKFDKNKDSCFAFGRKCPYYDLCHNNDDSNLVKVGKD